MKGSLLVPGLVLGFVAAATNASANIVISNLASNDGISTNFLSTTRKKGMSFFVDASSAYTIQSATLRFTVFSTNMVPVLTLHEDSGSDTPGAILGTFANPGAYAVGIANYTFTGSFLVQPSTKYWLQLAGGTQTWDFDWNANQPAQAPTGVWTHDNQTFTSNGGQTWITSGAMNNYEIKATAVPEPATMAALGLGLLAVVRRRKGA